MKTTFGKEVGNQALKELSDKDPKLISQKGYEEYSKFFPAGCSFQSIEHFRQIMVSGKFQKYKYEKSFDNIAKYGQREPPEYDTDNI